MTIIDPGSPAQALDRSVGRSRSHIRRVAIAVAATFAMSPLLGGCAVVTIAGAAASVAATAAATAVDVGVGAVKVTGKVIGKGVDLVTGPGAPPTPSRP